jgi:hypothetical protein
MHCCSFGFLPTEVVEYMPKGNFQKLQGVWHAQECTNYMYLTKKVQNEPDEIKRLEMLKIIRNGSVISWSHINFVGEYNFNEEDNQDSLDLDLSKIKEFKLKDTLDKVDGDK